MATLAPPPEWYLLITKWASLDANTSGLKSKKSVLAEKIARIKTFFSTPEDFEESKENVMNAIVEGLSKEDQDTFLLMIRKDHCEPDEPEASSSLMNFSKNLRRRYAKLYEKLYSASPPTIRGGYGRILSVYSSLRSKVPDLSLVKTMDDPRRYRKAPPPPTPEEAARPSSPISTLTFMSAGMAIVDSKSSPVAMERPQLNPSPGFSLHEHNASVITYAFAQFTARTVSFPAAGGGGSGIALQPMDRKRSASSNNLTVTKERPNSGGCVTICGSSKKRPLSAQAINTGHTRPSPRMATLPVFHSLCSDASDLMRPQVIAPSFAPRFDKAVASLDFADDLSPNGPNFLSPFISPNLPDGAIPDTSNVRYFYPTSLRPEASVYPGLLGTSAESNNAIAAPMLRSTSSFSDSIGSLELLTMLDNIPDDATVL